MKFGYRTFIATAALFGSLGLATSAASAMPVAAIAAPASGTVVHADKAAVVCIGSCYRRHGYYRPAFRPAFGVYARPYGLYRPYHRFGYYR